MKSVSVAALRVALVVPLIFEAYRLATFAVSADSWDLPSFLHSKAVWSLPAAGLVLACVLVLLESHATWAWLCVAASGLWLLYVDLRPYFALIGLAWRPSVEFAIGLYAVSLALAFLLGRWAHEAGPAGSTPDAGSRG